MAEVVSPIVYKKVEVTCYKSHSQILYDKYSNRLIIVNKESNSIVVISKDGKNLQKEIPFNFSLNMTIYKITFNCELSYMMMLCDDDKDKQRLMIINLDANKGMSVFKGEFFNCLGFFFIEEQMFNFNNTNSNDALISFVVVYLDQVVIYKISAKKGNPTELVQKIAVTKKKMFTTFVYSKDYMILCAQKVYIVGNENKVGFEFFNLSNPKFYQKTSALKIILEKDSMKVKAKTFKEKIKTHFNKVEINSKKEMMIIKKEDYSKSHFFLEKMYNTLYFIWLSYQDHLIHLYNVDNLDCIQREIDLQFEGDLSTLQFVDNLILLHNISLKKTVIYDVKKDSNKDKKIFEHFPISSYDIIEKNNKQSEHLLNFNFDFEDINEDDFELKVSSSYKSLELLSMQSSENIKIYEKDIQIQKNIIEVKEDNKTELYYIYFDPEIYFLSKNSLKNLLVLSRRKNAKKIVVNSLSHYLHTYTRYNKEKNIFNPNELHITELKKVLLYICELIVKSTIIFNEIGKFKKRMLQFQSSNSHNLSPNEIVRPYNSLFPKKKYLITQDNIYYQVFSPLEKEPDVNPEILILFFSFLHQEFVNNKINIQIGYFSTFIKILQKLKHFYRIQMLFQSSALGSNSYIASFLVNNIGLNKNNTSFSQCERQFAYQLGMDMYKRLKNYNEIVFTLLNEDKINEALIAIKKYQLNIKLFDKLNKKKIIDFCYRNHKLFN